MPHIWFYLFMCVSWSFKVLKWVIIAFISSVLSFGMFGGQISKNIHDVCKVCLEVTLCVLACFIMIYVLRLEEADVMGPIVRKHIWDETSGYDSTLDKKRGPKRGHQIRDRHCLAVAKRRTSRRPVDGFNFPEGWGLSEPTKETPIDGTWPDQWSVDDHVDGWLFSTGIL